MYHNNIFVKVKYLNANPDDFISWAKELILEDKVQMDSIQEHLYIRNYTFIFKNAYDFPTFPTDEGTVVSRASKEEIKLFKLYQKLGRM